MVHRRGPDGYFVSRSGTITEKSPVPRPFGDLWAYNEDVLDWFVLRASDVGSTRSFATSHAIGGCAAAHPSRRMSSVGPSFPCLRARPFFTQPRRKRVLRRPHSRSRIELLPICLSIPVATL